MSENERPHHRHDDDAQSDGAPPTDAVSDEVKADAAGPQLSASTDGDGDGDAVEGVDGVADRPAQTHP